MFYKTTSNRKPKIKTKYGYRDKESTSKGKTRKNDKRRIEGDS